MTLSPIDAPVRLTVPVQKGWSPPFKPSVCQAPNCEQPGSQWHHLFRRTQTAGPVDWIAIDGLVLFNKVRVCLFCHDKINNHDAWIVYDEHGWWKWALRESRGRSNQGEVIVQSKSKDRFFVVGKLKEYPLYESE